ncbi:MAG: methionyl-tRNA formyltransferase [Actinomycetota bacterium]
MRVAFLGSPDEAVVALRAIVAAGHDVAVVITRPDRRRRRGATPEATPVRRAADGLGIPVVTPETNDALVAALRESGASVGVVVAYGRILPPDALSALPGGLVNVHFSLLPRWRGAAPVERAILAGDPETGVCLMRVDEGLDTGPVFARAVVPIGPTATAGSLRVELAAVGATLLVEQLPHLADRTPAPQVGPARSAPKVTVDEFRIDPYRDDAGTVDRLVRAGDPRPGAWTVIDGERVKVLRVAVVADAGVPPGVIDRAGVLGTPVGGVDLLEVRPDARRAMTGRAFVAGRGGAATVDETR